MKNKIFRHLSFPFIRQANMMECGTTCLAMIFRYYGMIDVRSVLNKIAHIDTQGTNLFVIKQLAEMFGFKADGYKWNSENLEDMSTPCIAHYEGNHFVVIYQISKTHVKVADPAFGKYKIKREDFNKKWNGIVLSIEPTREIFKNREALDLIERNKEKKKNLVDYFYLSTIRGYKKIIGEILVASVIMQIIGLALPLFTQLIIDKVLVHQNKKLLFAILLGMVMLVGAQLLFTYARNTLLTQFKVQFELDFFSKFFDHFIHLRQKYFDNTKREELINRFRENIQLRQILSPSILQTLLEFVLIFSYVLILFYYNKILAGVALFFIALYVIMAIIFIPQITTLSNRVFNENNKAMGSFLDSLLGIQNIKLLGAEHIKFWKWKNQYKRNLNHVLKSEQKYTNLTSLLKSVYFMSQISVYWTGAYLAFEGEISIGEYIAFITIFMVILNSMNNVSNIMFMLTELKVSFNRLNDMFAEPREEESIVEQKLKWKNGPVVFSDVTFKYSPFNSSPILKNINLTIYPGEFVGIVGRNGSGKSTLVKLLSKLYTSYEGNILIGGTEIRDIHTHFYRKKIFMLPQDVYVFDDTIKANILYANPEATTEEVIEALKLADFYDFIKGSYLGLNQKVGEYGANLSGGQKLKLAFARMFITKPDIIILDEASSALDIETEQRIISNVRKHFKDATIISIAHRMATLKGADRIIVLDKGEISDSGSHEELLLREGVYNQFMKTYLDF